jgi:uncharacterized protein YecE (DUF72 family)
MTAELRIGASSWTSDSWWNRVYPAELPETERLAWYARLYDCVEVDATYYAIPSRRTFSAWAERTPDSFLFALKFPRDLMDPKRPVDREAVGSFLQRARQLGPKLGAILLQFPPWVKPGRLTRYIGELVDALDPDLPYSVELRDAGWFRGDTFAGLKRELTERTIACAWSYLTYVDVPPVVTTDWIYLRFIGDFTTIPTEQHGSVRVDRSAETRRWAERVLAERDHVRRVFVFFNNHYAGFAPDSINLFRRVLNLPEVDYAPAETAPRAALAAGPRRRSRRTRIEEYGSTPE